MKIKKYFKLEFSPYDISTFLQSVGFLLYAVIFGKISFIILILWLLMMLSEIKRYKAQKQLIKETMDLSKQLLCDHKKLLNILQDELPDQYIDKINYELAKEEDGNVIKVNFK